MVAERKHEHCVEGVTSSFDLVANLVQYARHRDARGELFPSSCWGGRCHGEGWWVVTITRRFR